MNSRYLVIGFLLILVFGLGPGCDDLFEEDLTDQTVVLSGPGDQITVNSGTIEFWWEELEGAEEYQFTLVQGTFDSPISLEADTSVIAPLHQLYLPQGEYQWQVKAFNQNSSTTSTVYSLTVDSLFQLSAEKINLSSPVEGACLSDSLVTLSWQALEIPGVFYTIDVRSGDFNSGVSVAQFSQESNSLDISIESTLEGQLSWGVRAENDNGASPYTSRSFTLDLTAPEAAQIVSPTYNDSVGLDVTFQWSSNVGSGCDETDSLYVYSDSVQSVIVARQGVAGGSGQKTVTLETGTYWWAVQRQDKAGNTSATTTKTRFYAAP